MALSTYDCSHHTMTHEIDYFRILDIDARQASSISALALRDCIRAKKKQWTTQSSNPLFQQDARSKLDQIRSFESLLDDRDSFVAYAKRMANQQQEIRATQEQSIGRLIRVALGNRKSITPSQHELLNKYAIQRNIAPSVVETMLKRLRVHIGEKLPVVREPNSLPYLQPALDRTTLTQINAWLAILDCKSFYELLDTPLNTSVLAIRRDAQVLFEKWSKVLPKSTEVIAWEKGLQACLTYLKDAASKKRYDASLTNQRIDEFVKQVDLVLASGVLDKESQMQLARIGMRQWGFSTRIIEQCMQSRASNFGLQNAKPISVSMRMDGQLQCMRCFAWSPSANRSCWQCGCSLVEKCKNPDCRRSLAPGAKRCDSCALPVSQGRRFASFLESADNDLANGNVASALQTCRHARRILPSPAVASRIQRAGKILAQVAVAQHSFAVRALSATHAALVALAELAPELRPSRVPSLTRLGEEMTTLQRRLTAAGMVACVSDQAQTYGEVLSGWSDCGPAFQKLWTCCESLSASGKHAGAIRYAQQLRSLRPNDMYVSKWVERLENDQAEATRSAHERQRIVQSVRAALDENRLYGAHRHFEELIAMGANAPDEARVFRIKVGEMKKALAETKLQAASAKTRDDAIAAYMSLLKHYPDCRAAVNALRREKEHSNELVPMVGLHETLRNHET